MGDTVRKEIEDDERVKVSSALHSTRTTGKRRGGNGKRGKKDKMRGWVEHMVAGQLASTQLVRLTLYIVLNVGRGSATQWVVG